MMGKLELANRMRLANMFCVAFLVK